MKLRIRFSSRFAVSGERMKLARIPSWLVDALGAIVVTCALVMAAWLGVVQSAQARTVVDEMRDRIAISRGTLLALSTQRSEQQRMLEDHERAILELGGSAENTTSEGYLQTVAALSQKFDVRILQHRQLGERRYPGLSEQRFSFHVSGTTKNLWLLLRAIEAIDAWADVSYLKMEAGAGEGDRMAALTISIFFEQNWDGSSSGKERSDG